MHTILLTRIFQTSSDELQRFNLVQSHEKLVRKTLKRRFYRFSGLDRKIDKVIANFI